MILTRLLQRPGVYLYPLKDFDLRKIQTQNESKDRGMLEWEVNKEERRNEIQDTHEEK